MFPNGSRISNDTWIECVPSGHPRFHTFCRWTSIKCIYLRINRIEMLSYVTRENWYRAGEKKLIWDFHISFRFGKSGIFEREEKKIEWICGKFLGVGWMRKQQTEKKCRYIWCLLHERWTIMVGGQRRRQRRSPLPRGERKSERRIKTEY